MTQTPNFQLNQWSGTDYVRRTDFNADNAKIDAALNQKGNCRIVTGSYTGTGKYGANAPNTLTFEASPKAVFLICGNWRGWWIRGSGSATIQFGGSSASISLSWGERSITWYGYDSAEKQLNTKGHTCYYFALLAND